jgi:RNA polymerase sigma-70 factor, ECF subfamily
LVNTSPFFRVCYFGDGCASGLAEESAPPSEGLHVATRVDFYHGIGERRRVTTVAVAEISDDITLVIAAREGDRAAFGRLYDRYARMVHGLLLSRVPPGDVDDLVQDVFLQALRRLHTLRETAAFGGWLATIARNRASDYYRRRPEAVELSQEAAEELPGGPRPEAEARAILAVIRMLPEAYRETLIMRLVEGMTGPEIAARTGLKPGSVRVNLHRGMQQLRERLAEKTKRAGKRLEGL